MGRYYLVWISSLLCCLLMALLCGPPPLPLLATPPVAAADTPAQAAITAALSSPPPRREPPPLQQQQEMKPYTELIPGSEVKFEMVPIAAGSFVRGSPSTEKGRSPDEGPAHEVTVRPFWMGKTEVTWDEYDIFAFSLDLDQKRPPQPGNPAAAAAKQIDALTRPTPPYADESFGYGKKQNPVISITHHAAMEYCRWLSAKTGKTYRLPTEAEWEYACRAGAKSAYSFGEDPAKLSEHAWFLDNSDGMPHAVGKKKPNAWGLHDMHGNVAEWVLDHYDANIYSSFKPGVAAHSPVLLPTERRYPHVVRGGSWDDEPPLLRCSARRPSSEKWSRRDPQSPKSIWWHTEAVTVGFRIVRPLEEQENLRGSRSKVTRKSP